METLSSIESFVRSAENGSFSAAARRLGLTPAAVSKNVAKLEEKLRVRLFHRSTRSLALTEAGERFLQEVGGGLSAIQTAVLNLASAGGQPTGTLKVSMGEAFGRDYLLPLLGEFLARYPAVVPDWHFENRPVDLVGEGFDAALGGGFDPSPGVVARELARAHVVAVASPEYLARRPAPVAPADLASHDGIVRRSAGSGRIRPWTLSGPAGEQVTVEVRPRMIFSDPEAIARGAVLGLGVGMVPMPHALPHLATGALVRLLPGWYVDVGPIFLYFGGQRLLPAKTRVFVDFVVDHFRRNDWARRLSAAPR